MKIGIISDTHDYLDPAVSKYFAGVDEIWHAGDIGSLKIMDQLSEIKPAVGVHGNIDDNSVRAAYDEDLILVREDVKILITHIAGKPPRYNARVKKLIEMHRPQMLVCGHSHILKVEYDKLNQLLFVNPGAAGRHGFHKIKTLLRLELQKGKIQNMEVVELGLRASL